MAPPGRIRGWFEGKGVSTSQSTRIGLDVTALKLMGRPLCLRQYNEMEDG
jgi:hypothetical protein